MIGPLLTIARLEWTAAIRLKWIRVLTIAVALLAIAAAYSAGAANELSGTAGLASTTMALIPVVRILVPLSAVVLGVSGQATEPGNEPFLFSLPVSRSTIVAGRWLGECAALTGSIVWGLSVGAAFVAFGSGTEGLVSFGFFAAMTVVLAIIFLSIAATISAATDNRLVALGLGIFAWFFFVLLYDGAALSAAGWLSGPRGARVLFGSVFGNPVDLIRVATLSVAG